LFSEADTLGGGTFCTGKRSAGIVRVFFPCASSLLCLRYPIFGAGECAARLGRGALFLLLRGRSRCWGPRVCFPSLSFALFTISQDARRWRDVCADVDCICGRRADAYKVTRYPANRPPLSKKCGRMGRRHRSSLVLPRIRHFVDDPAIALLLRQSMIIFRLYLRVPVFPAAVRVLSIFYPILPPRCLRASISFFGRPLLPNVFLVLLCSFAFAHSGGALWTLFALPYRLR
jgi:hypothetical protein